jgi:hypothetical protein
MGFRIKAKVMEEDDIRRAVRRIAGMSEAGYGHGHLEMAA